MATRPAVSVIIPVYNGEKYLRGCLDSVFSQTLKQLQVICVDDGSTDHSAQILSEYQNMHPDLVIVSQENGGLSAARNAGIRRATGEYIDFLDCDDTLRTDALEILYRRAHEDALDMLLYDGKTIFASEELRQANPGYETLYRTKIHIGNKPTSGEELFVRLVDSGSYRASACMYLLRLDYLLAKGYTFIQGIYYEDNVFTLQCLLDAARCGVEAIPFYHRSLRGSSIVTTHKDFRHARSYYVCETAMQSFLFSRSLGTDTIRCARQQISSLRHHALSVYAALSDDERKQAMAMYPDAILIDDMLRTSATAPKPAPRKKTEPAPTPEWMNRTHMRKLTGRPYQPEHPFISVIVPVYNAADYSNVYLDLPITQKTKLQLMQFTRANWITNGVLPEQEETDQDSQMILNFSGDFDSLAAKALLPDDTNLVAVKFGGWFERESDFFKAFSPYTVTTNFRQLKFDRESWTFVGSGALLYAKALHAKYNVFGTILEASAQQFNLSPKTTENVDVQPFATLGLKDVKLIQGLTEVGTAMVITHYYPDLVNASLKSLAAKGSEKLYRKQVLTDIVCKRYHREIAPIEFQVPNAEKVAIPFGQNFALDFLALYELKYAGKSVVQKTVKDIPEEADDLVHRLTLRFYERLNPVFLPTIPEGIRQGVLDKMRAADIVPYDEEDWAEFQEVKKLLSFYHKELNV